MFSGCLLFGVLVLLCVVCYVWFLIVACWLRCVGYGHTICCGSMLAVVYDVVGVFDCLT